MKTFDEVSELDHKEVAIKVIKHWLKQYYKFDSMIYPQSSILKHDELLSGAGVSGDVFCLRLDIDRAIEKLPHKLKKIIYMHYILGYPVGKICTMLGFKFRVDLYRKLDESFQLMYDELGVHWLRSNNDKNMHNLSA